MASLQAGGAAWSNLFEGTKKILVIKLRHIGDVLLTVPAIRALKENFPEASVTALVNSGTEDMLTLNPLLDGIVCYDRAVKKMPAHRRLAAEFKFIGGLRRSGFDMTVDLTGGDRPALIGFLTGAKHRLGYDPAGRGFAGKRLLYTHLADRPSLRTHAIMRDLGLLREFGIDTDYLAVDIHTLREDDEFVLRELEARGLKKGGRYAHIHPTSRWLFKCWTDKGMACVMDRINGEGLKAVITSGPDQRELEKVRSIISLMKTAPVDLSGRLKLKHLASLSRGAEFFLGVDSAPMHIAAAAGARVIGIFGPSGAFDWGPWDNAAVTKNGVKCVEKGYACSPYPRKGGVQRFGANIVIQKDWDCIPCGKDGCGGSKKSDCLDRIEPDSVWEAVKEYIQKSG